MGVKWDVKKWNGLRGSSGEWKTVGINTHKYHLKRTRNWWRNSGGEWMERIRANENPDRNCGGRTSYACRDLIIIVISQPLCVAQIYFPPALFFPPLARTLGQPYLFAFNAGSNRWRSWGTRAEMESIVLVMSLMVSGSFCIFLRPSLRGEGTVDVEDPDYFPGKKSGVLSRKFAGAGRGY